MRFLLALSLLLVSIGPVAAQPAHQGAGYTCTLYESGEDAWSGRALDPAALTALARRPGAPVQTVVSEGRASTFVVQYSGFTAEARDAFQRAVDIWADHLESEVPIRVQATFGPLGERVLGSAGPFLVANFPSAALVQTWYPFALADAISGRDLFPVEDDPDTPEDESQDDPNTPVDESFGPDIIATFSSTNESFYFGLDGEAPSDEFDFVTIVLHELGHGLGFVGSGTFDDGVEDPDATPPNFEECTGEEGVGCYGARTGSGTLFPYIFDRFVEDGEGTSLLNQTAYPLNSVALGDLLQSEDLFVDAPTVLSVNRGERPPIWAPSPFELGSSFSHWDEVLFSRGTPSSLMTPRLARGEAIQDPGSLTCAFFLDMGWPLGTGCELLVGPPPPPAGGTFTLERTGPNPFLSSTSFLLSVGDAQTVEATLYDTVGRRVAILFSGSVEPGRVPLELDGGSLAAATYVLVVRGETEQTTLLVAHVE
jgi:hypothetical protein